VNCVGIHVKAYCVPHMYWGADVKLPERFTLIGMMAMGDGV
jgi:hypothetical protein